MALERFWRGPSLDLWRDSRNLTQWRALAGTLRTTFAQSDDLLMVHLHLAYFRGLSSLHPFSLLTAWRQLLQNSQYQSCQELEEMDAAENIFGDHYGTSVVSPARILCLCFLFLFVVFQQKNASEVAELLL